MADSQASYFALWKPDLNEREDTDRPLQSTLIFPHLFKCK